MLPFHAPISDDKSLKAALEAHFGADESYGIAERPGTDELDPDVCARFPDGGHAAVCTNYAMAVFMAVEPALNPRLVWISDRKSPEARIVQDYESHDFCIVKDRYIVDAWAKNLDEYMPNAVLDLRDPGDQAVISNLYGSEIFFIPNEGLEVKARSRMVAPLVDGESFDSNPRRLPRP